MRPLARDLRVLIGWPFPLGFGLDGRLLLARRGRIYVKFIIIILVFAGARQGTARAGLCLIHHHHHGSELAGQNAEMARFTPNDPNHQKRPGFLKEGPQFPRQFKPFLLYYAVH